MTNPTSRQLDAKLEDFTEDILKLAEKGYSSRWITGFIAGKYFPECPSVSIPWDKIHGFLKKGRDLEVSKKALAKVEKYDPEAALSSADMPDPIQIINKVYSTMNSLLDENADMNMTREASVAAQQLLKTCEVILKVYDQSRGKSSSGQGITINYMENLGALEETLQFLEKNGIIKVLMPLDYNLIDVTPKKEEK